ncbi:MAG: glucose 1-dehydrogenase [Pseudorhodoplanes sp.]
MRAITVAPGIAQSARLDDVPEPAATEGSLLVHALALGVCGTDREILNGFYGEAPQGQSRLILGHESLGEIEQAPEGSGFARGDRVVGIVRRPDPVPCPACAAGEWDMCRNGLYRERGIKGLHGFGSEYFRLEPEFAVGIDADLGLAGVLLEPASVGAKAWDHIERIGRRSRAWEPRNLLVTGAGPIGLLAAMMGAQRGLHVHLFDREGNGPKRALADDLGAQYHSEPASLADIRFDVVLECTSAAPVIALAMKHCAASGIVCLLGVSAAGRSAAFDMGGFNRKLVLNNEVVFGSVNANLDHYRAAADALRRADRNWLDRLITRRVPLARFWEALERRPGDIKVIVDFEKKHGVAD